MSNKYYWHSRITEKKFRLIVNNFAEDANAAETSKEVRLTRKSVNSIFLKIRRCLYEYSRSISALQLGRFKAPNCSFLVSSELSLFNSAPKNKPVIFCALFDNGTIQTDIIYASDSAVFRKLKMDIQNTKDRNIQDFGFFDTQFNEIFSLSYGFPSFHLSYRKSAKQFTDFAGFRLKKLRGIRNDKLILHLKECEWRFNNRNNNLYPVLLEMLRKNPI